MVSSKASRARFQEWLESFGQAKYGFAKEIADLTNRSRNGVPNELPPFELWPEILPTLRVLEQVREKFGATTITSAYRSTAYNRAVGGERNSLHKKFKAIDFHCISGTPKDWTAFLIGLRNGNVFAGGIGTYRTFVHVDTRGTNATW